MFLTLKANWFISKKKLLQLQYKRRALNHINVSKDSQRTNLSRLNKRYSAIILAYPQAIHP